MGKAYSLDLRERVIEDLNSGRTMKAVSVAYKISFMTISRWKNRQKEGRLEAFNNAVRSARKLESVALNKYIKENPDATLKEIGEHFGAAASSVYARIKNLGFTYKKKSCYIKRGTKKSEKSLLKK